MGTTARDEAGPRLRILGATRLETAPGEEIRLRPRERALAAALALRHPRPAGLTDLAELLWTDGAPTTARKAIQNHVLRLRRAAVIDLVRTEPAG